MVDALKKEDASIVKKSSIVEARDCISMFYKQYSEKGITAELNDNTEKFVSTFYGQVLKGIASENYTQLVCFNRTSYGLFGKIYKEIKKNLEHNFVFNMGRIIGASQITYKLVDELYDGKIATQVLNEVQDRKDFLDILKKCQEDGKAYNQDLCDELDIKPNNLTKKMKMLMDLGLVTRHQVGKKAYYSLTGNGKQVIVSVLPAEDLPVHVTYKIYGNDGIETKFSTQRIHTNITYRLDTSNQTTNAFWEKKYG